MDNEKKNSGRPKKFKDVSELEESINRYKAYLEIEKKPPTFAGLAFYTGIDRQTLYNYKKDAIFFGTIKNFVDWVLMRWEELAISNSSSGLIFLLKNYGYTDSQEIVNTGEVTSNIKISKSDVKEVVKALKEEI